MTVELHFAYRGEQVCIVAPNEGDDIPARIRNQGTFYEFDVLERCEHYLRRTGQLPATIIDIGAYIGNHTLFFALVCRAKQVIALEASKTSFAMLAETIGRNDLENVRAFPVAAGASNDWGAISVRDPQNLGANHIRPMTADAVEAVRIVPLDGFLESIGAGSEAVSLIKIDVEGMEADVIRGAVRTIERTQPILCIEMWGPAHMRALTKLLRGSRYLIRECNGAAPTYILTPEPRMPRALVRLLNFGWTLLAYARGNAWRWRYRRVIEILFP